MSTPEADFPVDHIRAHHIAKVRAPAARFRREFAESLTDWRLGAGLSTRTDWQREEAVFRDGLAEIVRLRLTAAYAPLFAGIRAIDRLFAGVADLAAPTDRDFWAPKRQRPPEGVIPEGARRYFQSKKAVDHGQADAQTIFSAPDESQGPK